MKSFFNRYMKKLLKPRSYWLLIYHLLHYSSVFVKISSGKMSFLSQPDMQLATNQTGRYLLWVKGKEKNEDK